MRTKYEPTQAAFSQAAHAAARRDLYPAMFGTQDLRFSNVALHGSSAARVLDLKLGIDVIVYPQGSERLSARLPYYVQERFRRPEYELRNDVTITEFNHASGTPSELYKLGADLVVYGVYDQEADDFLRACAVDVLRLKALLGREGLRYSVEKNKKEQTFLGLPLAELRDSGCMAWELDSPRVEATPEPTFEPPETIPTEGLFEWYAKNDGWLPEDLRGGSA